MLTFEAKCQLSNRKIKFELCYVVLLVFFIIRLDFGL